MRSWRLLPFQRCDGAENMALDEAIFRETIRRGDPPTVRLYGWVRPVITIGRFQNGEGELDRSRCRERGIPVIRRPTGGKAVYHGEDLTYAVVASGKAGRFSGDVLETYRIIGRGLVRGLGKVGIEARLEERGRFPGEPPRRGGNCFALPARHELLVGRAKICGSAQVRARGGFLQHGSILMGFDARTAGRLFVGGGAGIEDLERAITSVRREASRPVGYEELAMAIAEGFEEEFGIALVPGEPTQRERALQERLLAGTYAADG